MTYQRPAFWRVPHQRRDPEDDEIRTFRQKKRVFSKRRRAECAGGAAHAPADVGRAASCAMFERPGARAQPLKIPSFPSNYNQVRSAFDVQAVRRRCTVRPCAGRGACSRWRANLARTKPRRAAALGPPDSDRSGSSDRARAPAPAMGRLHTFVVTLRRESRDTNWGLRLVGGADLATPLIVTRVHSATPYRDGFRRNFSPELKSIRYERFER
ncbi:hypothetical protein EVAR_75328_1 [Eumeta japonica]|uniref:Uncharacterized protein n=1 Tax=Eumeta variegata TaxID=151549 RepID=A0A4C1Y171_EUMVA|nr:hypothetical protein EVAR_75328_1 [Eumeta japonica]